MFNSKVKHNLSVAKMQPHRRYIHLLLLAIALAWGYNAQAQTTATAVDFTNGTGGGLTAATGQGAAGVANWFILKAADVTTKLTGDGPHTVTVTVTAPSSAVGVEIEEGAFKGKNIESFKFVRESGSTQQIWVFVQKGAFENVTGLKTLELGDMSRLGLAPNAFKGFSSLESIAWGSGGNASTSNILMLADSGFVGATGFKGPLPKHFVLLKETVTSMATEKHTAYYTDNAIPKNAFRGCTGLTTIDLSTVTSIGDSAFANCSGLNLTSATWPATATFGTGVFLECTSLSYANIKNIKKGDIVGVPEATFKGCTALSNVDWYASAATTATTASAQRIEAEAFMGCTALVNVNIDYVTTVAKSAFENCTGLTSIVATIGSTISSTQYPRIGPSAFKGCSSLVAANIPKASNIWGSAFENCTSLKNVVLGGVSGSATTLTFSSTVSAAFRNCTSLESIDLSNLSDAIRQNTFEGCSSLKTVILPTTAKKWTINSYAFKGCAALTEIDLTGKTNGNLGTSTFEGCTSLKTVKTVKTPSGDDAATFTVNTNTFKGCTSLETINLTKCTGFGESAFEGCTKLNINEAVWPTAAVSLWQKNAFKGTALTNVVLNLGSSINTGENTDASAFEGVSTIKKVVIKANNFPNTFTIKDWLSSSTVVELVVDGTTSIPAYAFKDWTSITDLSFTEESNGLTAIGAAAFEGCTGITTFDMTGMTAAATIGKGAFRGCTSLTNAVLVGAGAGLTISDSVFIGCNKLVSIGDGEATPSNVISIGKGAFAGCSMLSSADFAKSTGLITVGDSAFYKCSALTEFITASTEASTIGKYAFEGCAVLENVDISKFTNKLEIKDAAFRNCAALVTLKLPTGNGSTELVLGPQAFMGCTNLKGANGAGAGIKFPQKTHFGMQAFMDCKSIEGVEINATQDATLFSAAGTGVFQGCTAMEFFTLPATATLIPENTFMYCSNLYTISLGDDITSVGANAFRNCPMDNITIPASVTSIGNSAFRDCENLNKLIFSASDASFPTCGDNAFTNIPRSAIVCLGAAAAEAAAESAFAGYLTDVATQVSNGSCSDATDEKVTVKVLQPTNGYNATDGNTALPRTATIDVTEDNVTYTVVYEITDDRGNVLASEEFSVTKGNHDINFTEEGWYASGDGQANVILKVKKADEPETAWKILRKNTFAVSGIDKRAFKITVNN